ncbi:MAG: O-antigen ligase family protein [Lachnospiraceae bacterium]|nr:O-antigen ligase family protein [Lachnospiraceae bacterium]
MLRINKVRIIVFLMCLMLISLSVLSLHQNNVIRGVFLLLSVFLLICIRQSKRFLMNSRLYIVYLLYTAAATFLNHGLSMRLATALLTGSIYLVLFWGCRALAARYSKEEVLKSVFSFCFCFLLIGDSIVLFSGTRGIGVSSGIPDYLIGNKFTISYVHMLFLALYYWHLSEYYWSSSEYGGVIKRKGVLAFAYTLFICVITDCATGIAGCIALAFFYLLFKKMPSAARLFSNPYFYCLFMGIISVSVIHMDLFTRFKPVAFIIEHFFHRNLTLTGRSFAFAVAILAISQKPLYGHGINSTYVSSVLGWGNAQNGLLKVLLDYGVIGLLLFFWIVTDAFRIVRPRTYRKMKKKSGKSIFQSLYEELFQGSRLMKEDELALTAFLYAMSVCGTVEVCFSGFFFLGLSLLRMVKRYEASYRFWTPDELQPVLMQLMQVPHASYRYWTGDYEEDEWNDE